MAFKLVLFVAVCIAQGFTFQPSDAPRGKDVCKYQGFEIPFEFEEAMHEMDEVRETVSMAALDAYTRGNELEIIIACFRAQKDNYINLGRRISGMVRNASQEMAEKLGEKAEKYAKIIEVPLKNIALTMRALPEKVYNFIKNKEFSKAVEAMREARKVVEENSIAIAKAMRDMAGEVPELADRLEEMARNIHEEAKRGGAAIDQAFRKCVEEGGPKTPLTPSEHESFEE